MKTYLIVGGNGTIGKELAQRLLSKGNTVYTTSRNKNNFHHTIQLDLESDVSIEKLEHLKLKFDGIIFTAGYEPQQSLLEMTKEHQLKMIQIHLTGPINTVKVLLSKLNENSSIVFISSIAAYKGSYDPIYATVKGALLSLTRTFAVEFSKYKINVNCIAPGLIENSPVFNRMTQDFREKHISNTLDKKLATSDDCAEAIYFLLHQKHITGQTLHINGGQYFGN
jgi:3-oxoacyl-[acyl-carrier protein] reductase